MRTILVGVFVTLLATVVTIGGFLFVHKRIPVETRREHNDVAGFIYAVLGVIYAVLLAFTTIVVWEQFAATQKIVEDEANELAGIYNVAIQYDAADPTRQAVVQAVRTYAQAMIDEEWPMMAEGHESPRGNELSWNIRDALHKLPATNLREQAVYSVGLNGYHEFANARRIRLLHSHEALAPIFWVILIVGAMLCIFYTFLFGIDNALVHSLMIGGLTILIVTILFMIHTLDQPFQGAGHVGPDAFQRLLDGVLKSG